jgi:hypothetical protein
MGAVTVSTVSSNVKVNELSVGKGVGSKGSTIKMVALTPPASYDAGGSTIDFSTLFPERVYFVIPITGTAKDATTGYTQIGIIPPTAKTDRQGGYPGAGWKLQSSVGAAEASGDLSDHVVYVVACGC